MNLLVTAQVVVISVDGISEATEGVEANIPTLSLVIPDNQVQHLQKELELPTSAPFLTIDGNRVRANFEFSPRWPSGNNITFLVNHSSTQRPLMVCGETEEIGTSLVKEFLTRIQDLKRMYIYIASISNMPTMEKRNVKFTFKSMICIDSRNPIIHKDHPCFEKEFFEIADF